MTAVEKRAWEAKNFLGNNKAEKYKAVVETTLQNYHHFRPDASKIYSAGEKKQKV